MEMHHLVWNSFSSPHSTIPRTTLVNNRPALAKGGNKAKPEDTVGSKPKGSENKQKSPDGQSFGDMESQKNPSKGRKPNTGTTSRPGFKADRKALMEQHKRDGLCFKFGKEGHQSSECTDKATNGVAASAQAT